MRNSILSLLVAGFVSLVGCGGGGGNVRPEAAPRTLTSVSAANPERTRSAAARAATSLPQFGSVTQSSNRGVSGITSDAASTAFDGSNLALTVTRENGSVLRLNSTTDTLPGYPSIRPSAIAGHTSRSWGMTRETDTSLSFVAAVVSSRSSDPTEYLSWGLWLHMTGDPDTREVTGEEIGAFVDGPEISGNVNIPTLYTGIATYDGVASGLLVRRMGTEGVDHGIPQGTMRIGGFDGSLELVADFGLFGAPQISGTIDEIRVSGISMTPDGTEEAFQGPSSTVIYLEPLAIDSAGTFRGEGVIVTHPLYTTVESEGNWGGRFSSIDDFYGNPRLVAGTFGYRNVSSGGTEAIGVGSLVGITPPTER